MATSICPEPTISLSVFSVQDAIQYGMGHQWRRHADRLAGRIRRSFRAKSRRHQPGRQLGSTSGRKEKKHSTPLAVFGQSFKQWHRSNRFIVFVIFQILDLDRYDDKILDKNQNDERPCEVARAEEAFIQSRAIHHRLFAVSTFRGKRACVKANVSMCDLVARQRGTCVTTADPTSLNYAHAPNPGGPNVFCTPCIE